MTEPYRPADQLTNDELDRAGFADPIRARRLFMGLAGQGVTDDDVAQLLPSLLSALTECPDPDRSLANFARWFDALGNRATYVRYLRHHPAGVRILIHIGATSQFLADILARNPEYAEILVNPSVRSGAKPADQLHRELSALVGRISQLELKLEAMRRFRQREVLRIASRDLLGLADMPTTAEEFSNLADTCVQICLQLAEAEVHEKRPDLPHARLAVIALGKLGGWELNYSSDIDLVFVCEDTQDTGPNSVLETATRAAERAIAFLAREGQSGHLFRVDTRLRPEGRFGPLVRTLSSYRTYYENWAETWERQALLKARFVAGDSRLGEAFLDMLVPYAYPRLLTEALLADIRHNKRRMEEPHRRSHSPSSNVKTGLGGIRDIEFTVQLLQMRAGARDPLVRTPNTLTAISRLRQAGLLTHTDATALTDAYIFLRNVEHRLQLLYDRQTQELPATAHEITLLGRKLGFPDGDAFLEQYHSTAMVVREIHERIFYGAPERDTPADDDWRAELLALGAPDDELAPRAARDAATLAAKLQAEGFLEPERAVQFIGAALFGTDHGREAPDAVQAFRALAPRLLQECAHSPDPDSALMGMSLLADASPNRGEWYRALIAAPDLLRRLVRLAAGSRTLMQTVARHPEWIDLLASEEIAAREAKPRSAFFDELAARLASRGSSRVRRAQPIAGNHARASQDESVTERILDTLALYCQRERLRIGARDMWGETSAAAVSAELSYLSDAALDVLLHHAARTTARRLSADAATIVDNLAVFGLGKLGGLELSFYSDLDVLFVCSDAVLTHDGSSASTPSLYDLVTATAEQMLEMTHLLEQRGLPFAVDVRLRPEGRFGPLVASLSQFESYFGTRAETWERQMLVKARFVAGSAGVAARFLTLCHEFVFESQFGEQDRDAMRSMKQRIENERLPPDDRWVDIKLGHGGLSDIEFLTQLWQLRFGRTYTDVRATRTIDALDALASVGAIAAPDAERLSSNYRFLSRLRSRLALLSGQAVDKFPDDARRARALAIGFGATDTPTEKAEDVFRRRFLARMQESRRIFERLFYGESRGKGARG